MNLLTAEVDAPVTAPATQTIHTLFVIPESAAATLVEPAGDLDVAHATDGDDVALATDDAEDSAEPSFSFSTQMVLALILASVILTALAVTAVASFAPQGFSAGS